MEKPIKYLVVAEKVGRCYEHACHHEKKGVRYVDKRRARSFSLSLEFFFCAQGIVREKGGESPTS